MKHNLGNADRIIRILFAAVIAILYYINTITGTFAYVLLPVAGVLILTSFSGGCPFYSLFDINTGATKRQSK